MPTVPEMTGAPKAKQSPSFLVSKNQRAPELAKSLKR